MHILSSIDLPEHCEALSALSGRIASRQALLQSDKRERQAFIMQDCGIMLSLHASGEAPIVQLLA